LLSENKNEILKLKKEIDKLKAELQSLKKSKKFGLVWEDREREHGIDSEDHYPYFVKKGEEFNIDNGDCDKNLLIEGDNYHALEILNYTHSEKIDVIYIDPPYNTGKKKEFRYGDRWIDENDGYRHSYWLSFMNKRLKLAKKLLTKEGVIFISIDDHEQARLKLLCDDVFGKNNFISCLVWNQKTGTQSGHFTGSHEYILVYAKDKMQLPYFEDSEGENIRHGALKKISPKNPPSEFTFPKGFEFRAEDGKELSGSWGGAEKTTLISGRMIAKDGKLIEDVTLFAGWAMKSQMKQWIYGDKENTYDTKGQKVLKFYFNGSGVLWYEKERKTQHPKTVIEAGGTIVGSNELKEIFSDIDELPFKYPKPLSLIKKIIGYATNKKKSPIVLDFFAGSGTTAHAILELNKEDGGSRKFILCTNNENNICEEVTYQRIKKVIEGYEITKPKTKTKPQQVINIEGTGSSLEYLKIDMLSRNDEKYAELDIKDFLVDKCVEIIQVKESCFELSPMSDFLLRLNKPNKSVYILKNIYSMSKEDYNKTISIIDQSDESEVTLYILSLQNHEHYKQRFTNCKKHIIFEPLPEKFLKVLRKIQRNRK